MKSSPKKKYSKKPSHKPKFSGSTSEAAETLVRLNKYIANSGVCSRREADELIKAGAVKVNGKVVTEMGLKVSATDQVSYEGKNMRPEKQVYVLLNKPKDFITTVKDTHDRRTVMELVQKACKERIYPVGRLDRLTTGVLLFTNDGDLAKKLTHPSHRVRKIYHVTLNKEVTSQHLDQITSGVKLEDGTVKADAASFVKDSMDKREVGIELHSGKNRVVRRIFDALGYDVLKLDRVLFAELTKKDMPRGRWRFLTKTEVNLLKRMSSK